MPALIGAVVLAAAVASSGGSEGPARPAPAGAPLSRQLDTLQRSQEAVTIADLALIATLWR